MKKILGFMTLCVGLIALTACGSGSTTSTADSADNQEQSQLDRIKEAGVIRVGTSADFAPFEFHAMIDGRNTIVGADIDMMNAIGEELGVEVDIQDMEFNAVLAALHSGQVDVAVSGISATEERRQNFDFTINYFLPEQKIVIRKADADLFTSIADLAEKSVGAQKGSIQESVVSDQLPDSRVVSLPRVPNLVMELQQGSIDALVLESAVADSYVAQNNDIMVADIPLESSEDEAYAIALPKGSTELKDALNEVLQKLIDSGQIAEFVQKNTDLANENASR